MNRIVWFSFLIFFLFACSLSGQVENGKSGPAKGFTLVRKTAGTGPVTGAPVLDHWGRFVGQWSPVFSDSLQQYAFRFDNGKSATVPALSHVLYNPEADRLLVYGASVQSHVISEAELNVYTGSGSTVKNLGIVAYIPFKVGMAGTGDIYVAGKTVYEQAVFELKKYDNAGNLKWAINLPFGSPTELAISESGRRIGLALYDQDLQKTTLYYFDDAGKTLAYNTDFGMIANLEFLGDDKVIVCTGRQFYLYQITGQALITYAQFPGNAVGDHPITPNALGDGFVVTSVADPQMQAGYRVQAYSSAGVLLRESIVPGAPVSQGARMTVFQGVDEFILQIPQESVILKMDK